MVTFTWGSLGLLVPHVAHLSSLMGWMEKCSRITRRELAKPQPNGTHCPLLRCLDYMTFQLLKIFIQRQRPRLKLYGIVLFYPEFNTKKKRVGHGVWSRRARELVSSSHLLYDKIALKKIHDKSNKSRSCGPVGRIFPLLCINSTVTVLCYAYRVELIMVRTETGLSSLIRN